MSTNNPKDDMAGVKIKASHPLDNAVMDGLRHCQACAVETERAHKNMANCGRPLIVSEYEVHADK